MIATVGPASQDKIDKLIKYGVNAFRFNLKHNTLDWHQNLIKKTRLISESQRRKVAIIIDLPGPERRLKLSSNQPLNIIFGREYIVADAASKSGPHDLYLQKGWPKIDIGDDLYIDNGNLRFEIVEKQSHLLKVRATRNYLLTDHKSVNFPMKDNDLPVFDQIEIDRLCPVFESDVDFAAISFVRKGEDIRQTRKKLHSLKFKGGIIAKIENQSALNNLDEIIEEADAVMIARGDLGVEVPLKELALHQKDIVKKCRHFGKPVIVATQILSSMVKNPFPTRAEATDVANAVFDGADCLMLSEETSIGDYPLKAVEQLVEIGRYCQDKIASPIMFGGVLSAGAILANSLETMVLNSQPEISRVVIMTKSGTSAKLVSAKRLRTPTIAVTDSQKVARNLSISYGIETLLFENDPGKNWQSKLISRLKKNKLVQKGELIAIMHGRNWLIEGSNCSLSLVEI